MGKFKNNRSTNAELRFLMGITAVFLYKDTPQHTTPNQKQLRLLPQGEFSVRITNNTQISLPLAVWLADDDYDFDANRKAISATSLLKPVRQILLRERLNETTKETPDVSDFIASRMGHAIHDGMEKTWARKYRSALKKLGYPDHLIDAIRINPKEPEEDTIPVYLEQRSEKTFMGYIISGKFDMVLEGELNDTKSTSVWTYVKGSKDEDYCLQGSLYKWLNPDKITSDTIAINFVFTDWQRAMAKSNPDYPDQRVLTHRVKLMTLQETENLRAGSGCFSI